MLLRIIKTWDWDDIPGDNSSHVQFLHNYQDFEDPFGNTDGKGGDGVRERERVSDWSKSKYVHLDSSSITANTCNCNSGKSYKELLESY